MHGKTEHMKDTKSSKVKEIVGQWLFMLYTIFYAIFILTNVMSPRFMGIDVGALNIAIVFGFGLILLAIILAFAYNHISTHVEQAFDSHEHEKSEGNGGTSS